MCNLKEKDETLLDCFEEERRERNKIMKCTKGNKEN
jgi:hypothetical protein